MDQPLKWADPFYMRNFRGTQPFRVLVATNNGRLGVLEGKERVEVRVEPADPESARMLAHKLSRDNYWEQPFERPYDLAFTTYVSPEDLPGNASVRAAVNALLRSYTTVMTNPDAPAWVIDMMDPPRR